MIPHNAAPCDRCAADPEPFDPEYVYQLLEKHGRNGSSLLSVLKAVQDRWRYLPADALRIVARETGRPLVDVYATATFYKSFSLSPKGRHVVTVCLGTACHVRGGQRIADEFQRQLGIAVGETTADRQFTLETANCLGACALGPVVVIDGRCFSKVRPSRVGMLISDTLTAADRPGIGEDAGNFPLEAVCPSCGRDLMDRDLLIDRLPAIRLNIACDTGCGSVGLSSLYGSDSVVCEHPVPADTVVRFFCPHCREELVDSWHCPTCGAPMVSVALRWGGTLRICSRRGCKSRMLDLA